MCALSAGELEFEADLRQCLDVANKLSKTEGPETKRFVAQHITILQDFMQKKQQDAEDEIVLAIEQEESEIQSLHDRIQTAEGGAGMSVADLTYDRDMISVWRELTHNEWTSLYNCYIRYTNDPVHTIFKTLILILKIVYGICKERSSAVLEDVMQQAKYPGSKKQHKVDRPTITDEDTGLKELCGKFQKEFMAFCSSDIQKMMSTVVHTSKDIQPLKKRADGSSSGSTTFKTCFNQFIEKCIEFCWLASIEEPPVRIISNPMKECNTIAGWFEGVKKVPHQCFVQWPAIIQDDAIRAPWTLYDVKQERDLLEVVGAHSPSGSNVASHTTFTTGHDARSVKSSMDQPTTYGRPLPAIPAMPDGQNGRKIAKRKSNANLEF